MGKIVVSQVWGRLVLFLMDEGNHPQLIKVIQEDENDLTGNIYVGHVTEIVPGIQGAFLSISSTQKVFLSFQECPLELVKQENPAPLHQGDELPIQIISPAIKTKLPAASAKLCLTGRYCVCRIWEHGIQFSKKLPRPKCVELKNAIMNADISGRKNYGFTIRTNAGQLADPEPLFQEMRQFIETFERICRQGQHRVAHSCLYRTESETIRAVKNIPIQQYEEIVTDLPQVYESLKDWDESEKLRLYTDELLPLAKLYSLETHLKQALSKTVWLPCGGYLVIEPTEAMTVIDVNSGKGSNIKGISKEQLYLKVNREAAAEIAKQLRLRNLSGMIMVDFINMESAKDEQTLLDDLDKLLKEDPVKTRLVDMTALGIVEITRKKESSPLAQLIQ